MKEIIIFIIVAIAVMTYINSNNRSRLIDFLNNNVGNANGAWVKMTPDELKLCYKVFALIKQGVKPDDSEYLLAMDILKKYGITLQ